MTFELHRGSVPLLVSMPHMGTRIPEALQGSYVPRALEVEDTDWHMNRLYSFARTMGVSILQPEYSRYVIDLNRPPDDTPMYPGASNTELCPTRFFTGDPLYRNGYAPDATERLQRRASYWQPYHDALQSELVRIQSIHGYVLLWDAHSIRSSIPWLFEGRLPDLNIGTANNTSADARITDAVARACCGVPGVSHVVNGRFKGGYITRHYGKPAVRVHALQLEICQCLYMQEAPPFAWDARQAANIQPVLEAMVTAALATVQELYGR